jgi:hypothetical protein
MPAMEYPEQRDVTDARMLIAHLQQSVQGQIDGDQLLPADGSSLLALLERAMEGLSVRNAGAARAEIEAFVCRVQALMDGGVLDAADGRPLIEGAAPVRVWLPSAGRSG